MDIMRPLVVLFVWSGLIVKFVRELARNVFFRMVHLVSNKEKRFNLRLSLFSFTFYEILQILFQVFYSLVR